MLKLPSGCAKAWGAPASCAVTQRTSASSVRSAGRIAPSRGTGRLVGQLGEHAPGYLGVQHVEARVDREALPEILARLAGLAEARVDHPGVEVEPRVARA